MKQLIILTLFFITFLSSCLIKKDYQSSKNIDIYISNNGGTYSYKDIQNQECNRCTKKEVKALRDSGFTCE